MIVEQELGTPTDSETRHAVILRSKLEGPRMFHIRETTNEGPCGEDCTILAGPRVFSRDGSGGETE